MKYFILGLIVFICGLAYVRSEQSKIWNDCLAALKSSDGDSPASPLVIATPRPLKEEVIPTDSIIPNTNFVKQVERPPQPNTNVVAAGPKEFVPPDPIPSQPNWTWTVVGRDYHNVVVTKVEADVISITYDGGMGRVNQSDLTPDLQKMFNYDPQTAALASKEKAAALAKAEEIEAPKIAALKQQEQAQADADAAQAASDRKNDQNKMDSAVRADQIRQFQDDQRQMVQAHEVSISTDPKTGAVTVGGSSYWVAKYNADSQGIANAGH